MPKKIVAVLFVNKKETVRVAIDLGEKNTIPIFIIPINQVVGFLPTTSIEKNSPIRFMAAENGIMRARTVCFGEEPTLSLLNYVMAFRR